MTATRVRGRRWFLVQAGKGVLGFAVLGFAAACNADDDESGVARGPGRSGSAAGLDWWRVDFAYVSAYVLVRGREAVLVDCGLGSRVSEIEAVLRAAGTDWDRVRHILITHAHNDHHDGLMVVTTRAPGAALYAGATEMEYLPPYWSERLRPVTDGDEVFGLQVVETPGHTPGHIAVFDFDSRVSSPETLFPTPATGCKARWRSSPLTCRQPESRSTNSPLSNPRSSSSAMVPPSSKTPLPSCAGWPVRNDLTLSRKGGPPLFAPAR